MKKIIIASLSILMISCGASLKSNFTAQNKALAPDDKVAVLDIQNQVPEGAVKIGNAKYGDSGFSVDCGLNTNLINARKLAMQNGANIIKITEKKSPSMLGSSCYRIKVDFYTYKGDVSQLAQYQIQLN